MHMAHPGQFGCEMRMYRVRCRRRRWVRGTGGPARQPVFAYARRIALMPIAMNPNLPMGSLLRLPIHAETHAGFGEVGGMLSFDGQDLLVEFQTRDSLLGLLKGRPQTLRVPLHTIDDVRTGRGWFWLLPWFEIALNDFKLLTELPGAEAGRWRARVRFNDRLALQRFASAVSFARAQALHVRLTADLPREVTAPALPELPPAPPINPPPRQRASE